MTHTLISFLGRGHPDRGKRYQHATYDFGEDRRRTTEFFGLALTEDLRPDRLVVLGTTGSKWDVLLFSLDLGEAHEDDLLALTEAADADRASQEQLDRLAPVVGERLGLEVRLQRIQYGRTVSEQLDIVQVMAASVAPGETVSLDITHGLRHLPMLSQASALYLRKVADVEIKGIYYGALDMKANGVAPVMNLSGLLSIADWVGALNTFDKDGDYSVFAKLLQDDLPPETCGLLEGASFFEISSRVGQARGKLRAFEKALSHNCLPGIARLFEPTLRARIAWCHEDRLYQRQRALAVQNLERGDYLRAALYGYEAFVTREVQRNGGADPERREVREEVKNAYETTQKAARPRTREYSDYELLRDLRNHLAHGNAPPRGEVQTALANQVSLRKTLGRLMDTLLPDP